MHRNTLFYNILLLVCNHLVQYKSHHKWVSNSYYIIIIYGFYLDDKGHKRSRSYLEKSKYWIFRKCSFVQASIQLIYPLLTKLSQYKLNQIIWHWWRSYKWKGQVQLCVQDGLVPNVVLYYSEDYLSVNNKVIVKYSTNPANGFEIEVQGHLSAQVQFIFFITTKIH